MDEVGRVRIGKAVRSARLSMGVSVDVAAVAGRMATATWTRVEKGQEVRELSYAGVERALGWAIGTCEDIASDARGDSVPYLVEALLPIDSVSAAAHDQPPTADEAIRNDPTLSPEARTHLLNQIRLLRLLPTQDTESTAGQPEPDRSLLDPEVRSLPVRSSGQPPMRAAALTRKRDVRKPLREDS